MKNRENLTTLYKNAFAETKSYALRIVYACVLTELEREDSEIASYLDNEGRDLNAEQVRSYLANWSINELIDNDVLDEEKVVSYVEGEMKDRLNDWSLDYLIYKDYISEDNIRDYIANRDVSYLVSKGYLDKDELQRFIDGESDIRIEEPGDDITQVLDNLIGDDDEKKEKILEYVINHIDSNRILDSLCEEDIAHYVYYNVASVSVEGMVQDGYISEDDVKEYVDNHIGADIIDNLDEDDVIDRLDWNIGTDGILEHLNEDAIAEYAKGNLDMVSIDDIKDYIKEDMDGFELLASLDDETIKEYVANNFSVDDMTSVRWNIE